MSLMFPNPDYADPSASLFLEKLKAFEEQVIQDVADHSGQWFNEEIPVDFVKRMFSPMLKHRKNKDPSIKSKFDYNSPPSLSVKVPYDKNTNQWKCEIYDSASKQLFPSTTTQYTPIDLIPKMSKVACVIQCGSQDESSALHLFKWALRSKATTTPCRSEQLFLENACPAQRP
jgi:hypothetical protein